MPDYPPLNFMGVYPGGHVPAPGNYIKSWKPVGSQNKIYTLHFIVTEFMHLFL